jgi:hypothetical protein
MGLSVLMQQLLVINSGALLHKHPFNTHLERPVSQQPQPVAVPTEGVSHARDEAHTALEARHTEVLGHLTSRVSMAHEALREPADSRRQNSNTLT